MKVVVWVIIILLVAGAFYLFATRTEEELPADDVMEEEVEKSLSEMMQDGQNLNGDDMVKTLDDKMKAAMMKMVYQYSGGLEDVTKGEDVRGVNTLGKASGLAKANYADNKYDLLVTFENLPDPKGDDFYEGWIVRRGLKFSVISSGALQKIDGAYVNTYASGQNLIDHDFYVLTLEPNDGNPAPADHILEGVMEKVSN